MRLRVPWEIAIPFLLCLAMIAFSVPFTGAGCWTNHSPIGVTVCVAPSR